MFISDRRAIAVGYEGGLFEFDPQDPHPQAQKAGAVPAPVRAATLASVGPDGTFTLATLTDGAVEVNEIGQVNALLRVLLPQEQSPFAIGWESLRVCGGNLSVLATATAPQISTGFGVPYTIHADGRLVQTGSLINSLGLICLPGGSALAADLLHGQYTFPAREGPMLPGLATGTDEGVTYSFASSENNQWAAAAGADGTLKIVELQSYGQQRPVQSLEVVAPGVPGAPLVVSHGEVRSAPLTGGTGPKIADGVGGAARGSYYDPRWGTVLAIGKELLIVRNDHVRQRIAIDHSIYEIGPGRPGVSTLVVLANARDAIDVALADGQRTTIELPPDVIGGATQLSDTVELPGSRPRLVTATTDGYLDLLSYPSGKELRRRRVAPPGPVSLALSGDGHLLASASDGIVRILDPQTLAIEGSRRVLSAGPSLISTNMAGTLAAVFSGGGEAVVLDLPSLDPITHVNSIEALVSVSLEGGRSLLLGSDLHYIGGGDQASVTTWPLCRACGGSPAQLRVRAAGLAEPGHRGHGQPSSLLAVRRMPETNPSSAEPEMALSSTPESVLARKGTLCSIDKISPVLIAVRYGLVGQ